MKFSLGQIVATPNAIEAMEENSIDSRSLLLRHANGDWGCIPDEDKQENELSLKEGFRLLSAYESEGLPKIWIITEADRSATTILFPEEY